MAGVITLPEVSETTAGAGFLSFVFTFDSSYPTGGELLDLSDYFSGSPKVVSCGGGSGYVPQHDQGTAALGKLMVFEAGADGAALDEVTAATDLSALACTVLVHGVRV